MFYFLLTKLLGNHLPLVYITLIMWFDNEIHKKTNHSLLSRLSGMLYGILGFLKEVFTISEAMISIYPPSTQLHQQMKYFEVL